MIARTRRYPAALTLLLVISAVAALAQAPQTQPTLQPTDPGWPRTFTKGGTTAILYQPQVDSWNDYDKIQFRCAVEVTPAGATEANYGVVEAEADTDVNHDTGTVVLSNMTANVRFQGIPADQAAALSALVKDLLPNRPYVTVSLDRVLAYMHDTPAPAGVQLNLDPPPIYYSSTPAILVVYMGQPEFKPVPNSTLMWAVNTNWVVLMDTKTSLYYLLVGKSWMTARDPVKGPWTAAGQLPSAFSQLPNDAQWADIQKSVPGQPFQVVPSVITSTVPAEMILTNGTPDYSPIVGTSLMYVSNPQMPVFMDLSDSNYYYLVAGRWFSAPAVTGPWAAASASLPAEFSRIPEDSPMAFVLSSVPGTLEAKDAILLASVPHKATITISDATLAVAYQGNPKFVAIPGTPMKYAVNTAYQVINANGQYYCCYNGVWFVSPAPTGAWAVCTSVPAVIYTIPPSCPVYNVTYVQVYSSTPTTVVCGYTSGYSGEYVAATGALMFGAGMLVGAAIADNDCWHPYYPCCYSYGCAGYYHYGYGGYYSAGYAHYGPYGSAGYTAHYNAATGTYSRSAYASDAYGSASVHQAYNPYSNTYAAHGSASNGYESWGGSTVSQGDKWASSGHTTNEATGVTHGWADDSAGQSAQYAHKGDTSAATTGSGDKYAAHDGNVYKNTGSGWQSYNNGSWNNVQKPAGSSSQGQWASHDTQSSLNQDSWSRNYGNSSSRSWGGGGGDRSWGGGGGSWGGGGRSWGGGGRGGGRR